MLESIPDDFLWGAALHGHCVEGGYRESDWCHWEKRPGNIADNEDSSRGADFWNRYKDDIRVARDFGLNALLITLEWSRIVPEEGSPNRKALNHYAKILSAMNDAGIKPIVALSHVALPTWIADQGGWLDRTTIKHFNDYVRAVIDAIGNTCTTWIPILEPAHYALRAYRLGHWPPNQRNARAERNVLLHLMEAHELAYATIKHQDDAYQVGAGVRMAQFDPQNPYRAWDTRAAIHESFTCNLAFLTTLFDEDRTTTPFDFIGLSYYGQHTVAWKWPAARKSFVQYVQSSARSLKCTPKPDAIEKLLTPFQEKALPLYILGNGSDSNDDAEQCNYLLDHIEAVSHMLNQNVDLRGYLYYGLLDGFEWERGYASTRGLFHVDPNRLTRTPKPVALMLKELIATGSVRASTLQQFTPDRAS